MIVAATEPVRFSELRARGGDALRTALAGDPAQAARWIDAAARYGLVEAQAALGQILLDGRGVVPDPVRAFAWFAIAAKAGHVPAINMVGRCCERGWGTDVDLVRAARCFRHAAEAGLDWGQYNLANMTLRGRGTRRDRPEALRLYRLAADQGHAKSMNLIGRFLEEGWVSPANPKAAAAWYFRAAEAGDFRGQYNLASLLVIHGRVAEAAIWLRRAMTTASLDFLALMGARLGSNDDPVLREIGAEAGRRARAQP